MQNSLQIGIFLLALLFVIAACSSNRSSGIKAGDPRPTSQQLAASLGIGDEPDRLPARFYSPSESDYAPAKLELTTINGRPYSLKGYQGRWLLLDFFTTYAVPSQSNMPVFDKLYCKYKAQGLQVVGVSLDLQGKIMVQTFIETLEISYPVLLAGSQLREVHKTPYGFINEIPVALLIDPDGKLVKGYLGMLDEKTITEDISDKLDVR